MSDLDLAIAALYLRQSGLTVIWPQPVTLPPEVK